MNNLALITKKNVPSIGKPQNSIGKEKNKQRLKLLEEETSPGFLAEPASILLKKNILRNFNPIFRDTLKLVIHPYIEEIG